MHRLAKPSLSAVPNRPQARSLRAKVSAHAMSNCALLAVAPRQEDPMAISERTTKRTNQDTMATTTDLTATEIGCYVRDLAHGMRQITLRADQKDVRFLDYLLAIVEEEARKIAEHSYH
jgi:hypothetical protein